MPLPKIDLPIFDLKLVSIPEPVKFRPFLVKEEKLLLMALQTSKEEDILKAIKQVVNNCLVSEISIESLPIFDIEYLFLNIRARSVGEKVENYFVCRNVVGKRVTEDGTEEDEVCMHMMPVEVNILDIKPPVDNVPSRIYVTKDVGVQMKFPTLSNYKSINELTLSENANEIFDIVYDCCEYVFDEKEVYYTKESSKEEFFAFIESLTQEQFDKITGFFEQLPTISHDVKHSCQKCGYNHNLHLEGLSDFFT
jgi:hypothetical protein